MTRLSLLGILLATTLGCSNGAEKAAAPERGGVAAGTSASAAAQPADSSVNYAEEVSRLVYQKDEIVSILRNGMVVIIKRVGSPAVSVRGYVATGGLYEGKWLGGGLSHLLEHLVAGGTNARRTEAENRNLLQQIGNNSNAYTTSDHTAYFVNTTAENLDKAVDLVTGWMLTAKITPEEFDREREVVQRELEKDMGEPDWVYYMLTQRNRYTVSPARVPVIGYQAVIQNLTRDDVYEYYKLAYVPNNMVFAIAGDVDPEQVLRAVQKNVHQFPPGRVFSHDIAQEPPVLAPRTIVNTFPKLGQARLELAFPSIKLTDPDLYALDLLATILADGESSILVQEIRDKRGLVSGISASSYTPEYATGSFSIDMELDPDKIGPATSAVLDVLEQIKKNGVSEDRLQRAKTQTKTARAFRLQTSEQVAGSLATDYLSTGDPHFSDRYVDRMQQVTADQVKQMAIKYLDRQRLLTTALVPAESAAAGLPSAADLLREAAPTTQKSQVAASDIRRVECNDGTILLLKRLPTAPIATIQMYALGGVTAENEKNNGIGFLTMLTVPRGTKNRSAREIAEFFDSIGGSISTTSGNNSWAWSSRCLKDDVGKTLEVFADLVRNASFPDSEVNMMKKRLLAAIASQDADWFASSMRFFRKSYFGPSNSPYQFLAIGTAPSVSTLTPDQVRAWYADRILKSPRVLAIFGDIDLDQTRQAATRLFGGEKQGVSPSAKDRPQAALPNPQPGPASIRITKVLVNRSPNPQCGVIIGFNSNSVVGSPLLFPLTVADTMASGYGYPTGYMFETLRGMGLVYDAQAFVFPGRSPQTPGAFLAYAGCDPKDVNQVIDQMLLNIARLQGSPQDLQPDWFERSKKLIVTSDALENETPSAQATTAALDELFGLGYNYHASFADNIGRVQLQDIPAVARSLLRECVITITTNAPDAVKVQEGERRFDSFPPVDLTPRGVQHDSAAGK